MSENNTQVENNVEGFDLTDWLVGGTEHRAKRKVVIYQDANLPAEVERVEALIRAEQKNTEQGGSMDSLGDSTIGDLEREKEQLLERLKRAKAEVTVFGLIETEAAAAREAAGKEANAADIAYHVFERAATLSGQKLTADQWRKVHETIGSQFNVINQAYMEVLNNPVDARFRS